MARAWFGVVVVVALHGCSFIEYRSPDWPRTHHDGVDCYTGSALPTIDLSVGALLVAGPYLALRDFQPGSPGGALGVAAVAGSVMLSGIAAMVSGLYGYGAASNCRSAKRELHRLRVAHERRVDIEAKAKATREEAWQATKQAAAAARKDGCRSVRALDAKVRALDAAFHASVFVHDVAIARCLAQGAR